MEEKLDFLTYKQHVNEYLTKSDNSADNKHDVLMLKNIFKFIYKNFAKINELTIEMADVLPILHHSMRLEVQSANKMHIGAFLMVLLNLHGKNVDGLQKCLQIIYQILKTLTPEDTKNLQIGNEIFFKLIEILSSNYSTSNNAHIIVCLQLFSKKFEGENMEVMKRLWNVIKESLNSNQLTEISFAHLQIFLTFFDEFSQHIKEFKASVDFTRLIQHLLNSDQYDIRKSAYLILKKSHVLMEEQIHSHLATMPQGNDMQKKNNFWIVLINCFENLEEKQSQLVVASLEQLRNLNISNLNEQFWLDTLYRQILRHDNILVRGWILEYIMENLTYFSMTNETQMEFMRAINDTSLYNVEGYMLPGNNVGRFLKCNRSQFLLSFSQIDWKAIPLHYWLSNLIAHWKNMHKTDVSNEVLINLAKKIRSLQNVDVRRENMEIFKELFSIIIDEMDLSSYVQLIEALHNTSVDSKDVDVLWDKIENCQDCDLDLNRIFTQRFYKMLIKGWTFQDFTNVSCALVDKIIAKNWQPGLWRFIIVFKSDISISKLFCKTHYNFEHIDVKKETTFKQINDYYMEKLCCTNEEESVLKLHTACFYLEHITKYEDLNEDDVEEFLNLGSDRILKKLTGLLKKHNSFVGDSMFEMILNSLRSHSKSDWKTFSCGDLLEHCRTNPNKNQVTRYIEMLTKIDFEATEYTITFRSEEFTISDEFLLEKALNLDTKVGDSRIEEAYVCKILDIRMGIPHYKLVSFTNALLFNKDGNERSKFLKGLYEKIESINSRMPKYCANSREHRLLSRLLYIILRFVNGIDLDSESLTQLWKLLMEHNNQPNIAIFYQIIIANKFGWHEIFSKVSTQLEANKCTPSQEIYMIAILYGSFQKNLKDLTSKELGELIDLLWPLTMRASFQKRLYAQLAIFNTVDGFRVGKLSLPETFIKLSQTIRKTITDEQIEKFQEEVRLMDTLNYYTFDNVMYYTNAPYDDYNRRRVTINNSCQNEKVQCASIRTIEASCDVQRKLKPITDFMPQSNLYSYPEVREHVLYVVASLVGEIPNLGCIARTCEVLGVRNLVIDSKAIIAKDDFKNLSMTAEKNLNIIEVKPSILADFLIKKKAEGFKIIGAEKTANSCSFVNFQCPKRSVLLLGHEKEGIPPNLLGFLDYAVEIPQFGMIRSLNAHVTGALFMWEYCKQHTHCEE